ncbi:ABC transporter permease [Chelativorans sp. YIM 93263]|uniref:ABC transporter permease n=1 Tax=Chelativorans sp. YIM 93263 TaxID=2906648 RepID=UPI0023786E62|nr:ABC transporter permease [Chelativorans sp. YIM 93263]
MSVKRNYDIALAIALAISVLLFLVPQFFFLRESLFESLGMGMSGDTLTLVNYRMILTDTYYLEVFWRTFVISAAGAGAALLLGYPTAYWLTRMRSRFVSMLIILLLVSSFVSIVVKVLGLSMLLSSQGPLSAIINVLSLGQWQPQMLHNDFAVGVGLVQYTLPLVVMLLFGVIQTIPESFEEAAIVHGATDWRLFRRVILPLSLNGVLTAGLIAFNMNMGAFTSAVLLGGGNVLTVPVLIQQTIILDVDYPLAATLAVLLTSVVLLINLALVFLHRFSAIRQPRSGS